MPTYRANVTDTQQAVIEQAQFEGGVPVFVDQETREVIKDLGGTEKTAHGTTAAVNIGKNAGVAMPWDDKPGQFLEQSIGRRA
jgi:hypothetical protein